MLSWSERKGKKYINDTEDWKRGNLMHGIHEKRGGEGGETKVAKHE